MLCKNVNKTVLRTIMVSIIVSVNCDEVLGQLICFYLVRGYFVYWGGT